MILNKLIKQANERPDKIALQDEHSVLTYTELLTRVVTTANALLAWLTPNGNVPIVVFIERNIESIVSFFSVLATGNFYVPIDVTQPNHRISLILQALQPELLINTTKTDINDLADFSDHTITYASLARGNAALNTLQIIETRIIDADPVYAMYTSGSTGVPKGVLISYRGLNDLVNQFIDVFHFSADDVFGNQAPFDFDVSVKDIYNALEVGATLKIIPRQFFSFPKKLIDYLNTEQVTVAIWAVSALRIVENLKGFTKEVPQHLRFVMFSGEAISNKTLNYWRMHVPAATYVNLYGPTEITCNCAFYIVDRAFHDHEPLPMGIAFANTRIVLLDEQNALISKPHATGEICVIGSSLGLGYYNNMAATERAFVNNPLVTTYAEPMYRTGDLGYINDDGLLIFRGRKDHQIKHMGQRIEFGEIETNAEALDLIEAACCIYDEDAEKIVLFYQAREEDSRSIYKALLERLPKYMVPTKMMHFDKLPLNNNAKIDRVRLANDYYAQKN